MAGDWKGTECFKISYKNGKQTAFLRDMSVSTANFQGGCD